MARREHCGWICNYQVEQMRRKNEDGILVQISHPKIRVSSTGCRTVRPVCSVQSMSSKPLDLMAISPRF